MRPRSFVIPLFALVACHGAPVRVASPETAVEGALRTHDPALVKSLSGAGALEGHPRLEAEIARATTWAEGYPEARARLEKACRKLGLPDDDSARAWACAALEQLALAGDKRFFEVGGEPSELEFLRGPQIPVVLASVNGLPSEPFIVDSGAASTVLSKSYCDRAKIPYSTAAPKTALDSSGQEIRLPAAFLTSVRLGALTVQGVPADVLEFGPDLRIGGILSPQDTFRGLVTVFDFRARRLVLLKPEGLAGFLAGLGEPLSRIPLTWEGGNVFVPGSVDGRPVTLLFDTGSSADFVTPQLAEALGKPGGDKAAGIGGTDPSGATPGFEGSLRVGESEPFAGLLGLKPIRIDPPDPGALPPLGVDGQVGLPWMSGRIVVLPPGGRELLVTVAKMP